MTNTAAPRQTARDEIRIAATLNGWTSVTAESGIDRYTRGELRIVVAFTARGTGAVKWAERRRPSISGNTWIVRDSIAAEDKGKRETVTAWLTEAVEQAPEGSVTAPTSFDRKNATASELRARATELHQQADAYDGARRELPYGDARQAVYRSQSAMLRSEARELVQLADHLDADPAPSRGLAVPMERETGGTIDLDQAAHDQAAGSPERLAELGALTGDAQIADHAAILRDRIAELELMVSNLRKDRVAAHEQIARQNKRIAELEADARKLAELVDRTLDEREQARARIAELEADGENLHAELALTREEREQARRRVTELEAQSRPPITMRALLSEAQARIAELESENVELETENVELVAERDRIRKVADTQRDRLAQQGAELADAIQEGDAQAKRAYRLEREARE